MDLRLILGGGTAAAGPPELSVGPPGGERTKDPAFANLLNSIQSGGEIHGEEVAIGPNAQPQNLDSVLKSEENSSPVLAMAAVSLPTPILDSSQVVDAGKPVDASIARTTRNGTGFIANGLSRIRPGAIQPQVDPRLIRPMGGPNIAVEMPKPGRTPQDLMIMAQDLGLNPTGVAATTTTEPGGAAITANMNPTEMPKPGQVPNNLDPTSKDEGSGSATTGTTVMPSPTNTENQSGMAGQGQGQSGSQNSNSTGAVKNDGDNRIDAAKGLSPRERAEAVRQVQKGMERINLRNSRESIQIRLEPEQLGKVVIELQRGAEGLTAMLQASNEPLREALQQSRGELAASMAAKGVHDVKVTVQATTESSNSQSSTSNSNQQSNQQGQNQQARDHSRPQAQDNFLRQFSFHSNRTLNKITPTWKRRSTTRLDIAS